MSRIGNLPVNIPAGVKFSIDAENCITITGPLGELKQKVSSLISVKEEEGKIKFETLSETKEARAMHGLYRSLVNNMVEGVSKGFETKQEFVGVGYKAEMKGQQLVMALGYSHEIIFELPKEIKAETLTEKRGNPILTMRSADKQLLGQVAAKVRSLRKPEPYKGKGIKYVGEELRRKAGKAAGM